MRRRKEPGEDSLYQRLLLRKPRFSTNEEALTTFTGELEHLASQQGKTIPELVIAADSDPHYSELSRRVLRLSSRIRTKHDTPILLAILSSLPGTFS